MAALERDAQLRVPAPFEASRPGSLLADAGQQMSAPPPLFIGHGIDSDSHRWGMESVEIGPVEAAAMARQFLGDLPPLQLHRN